MRRIKLVETRGPKFGHCNMCGEPRELTEDHTPPKGCYKPKAVELFPIMEHLAAERPKNRGRISQNGVKYRTLCSHCNNQLLGQDYDPAFIGFVNGISQAIRSPISLPSILSLDARPQPIMKSLIGHLSAQGVGRYSKGQMTEPIKEYLLSPNLPLPSQIKVYCWSFPYNKYVMARDCGLGFSYAQEKVSCWFLKFFPVGFLVTFFQGDHIKFTGLELSQWRNAQSDEIIKLPFPLKPVPPQYWPEAPLNDSIVMYGEQAITSFDLCR